MKSKDSEVISTCGFEYCIAFNLNLLDFFPLSSRSYLSLLSCMLHIDDEWNPWQGPGIKVDPDVRYNFQITVFQFSIILYVLSINVFFDATP